MKISLGDKQKECRGRTRALQAAPCHCSRAPDTEGGPRRSGRSDNLGAGGSGEAASSLPATVIPSAMGVRT